MDDDLLRSDCFNRAERLVPSTSEVIKQVKSDSNIKTPGGKARAWLRLMIMKVRTSAPVHTCTCVNVPVS